MRVAVSGPVSITDAHRLGIGRSLHEILEEGDEVFTGGAYGVDTHAALWSLGEGFDVVLVVPQELPWHRELEAVASATILVDGLYMERNERIADLADKLIAFPFTKREHLRSGTWATVRRFEARMKPVTVRPLSLFK